MGEGGIKNGQKNSDVFYGRPLTVRIINDNQPRSFWHYLLTFVYFFSFFQGPNWALLSLLLSVSLTSMTTNRSFCQVMPSNCLRQISAWMNLSPKLWPWIRMRGKMDDWLIPFSGKIYLVPFCVFIVPFLYFMSKRSKIGICLNQNVLHCTVLNMNAL